MHSTLIALQARIFVFPFTSHVWYVTFIPWSSSSAFNRRPLSIVHKPKNVNSCLVTKTNIYYIDCPWAIVTLKLEARHNIILKVLNFQLDSSEISPTRCNNCVFFFSAMALLYMFRATISPIIRSTYAVYGHR